jgi:hypothetical protein
MMRIASRLLLIFLAFWFFANESLSIAQGVDSASVQETVPNDVLVIGLRSLMNLQGDDGGWHSQHYGTLKQGAAMTTMVLYAVSHVPESIRDPFEEQIQKAFQFLQPGLQKSGFVTNAEGSQDYPVYCTAMLLVASEKLELELDEETQARMVAYLLDSQVAEGRGFEQQHPEYGGWDVLGPDTLDGKTSGTNVSATCYVAEALQLYNDQSKVIASLEQCQGWLDRIVAASADGGLFFAPKLDSMNNKARWTDEENQKPRSYGTATSDGLRIMKYCGVEADKDPWIEAQAWLAAHPDLEQVPGFGKDDTGWRLSLKFYYFATLAKTLPLLDSELAESFRVKLAKQLKAAQANSGLWQNQSALMREDDPIIATSFAVMALGLLESE